MKRNEKIVTLIVVALIIIIIFALKQASENKDLLIPYLGRKSIIEVDAKYEVVCVTVEGRNVWVTARDTITNEISIINKRRYFDNIITIKQESK